MKVIENNFSKENPIHLKEEEIRILKTMIKTLRDLTEVECIELIPSRDNNDGNGKILINIIESSNLEDKQFIKKLITGIHYSLEHQETFTTNHFLITSSPPIETISSPEMKSLAKKEIVSSYIVFDRNGRYTNLQDYLKEYIVSFGGLIQVDNIKKLDDNFIKKIIQGKRNK